MSQYLLEAQEVTVRYRGRRGMLTAVDGVNLTLQRGETLGIVGESGCGKSSLGKALVSLQAIEHGQVLLDGQRISGLTRAQLMPHRKKIQMVFQDSTSSLDPRQRIRRILETPLALHGWKDRTQRQRKVEELLAQVGLPAQAQHRYPHEFSGGQRQRLNIARAIALQPDVVICDEPVSSLDVSLQAQVLNLLQQLQRDLGMAYVFISHDLSVIGHMADRIAVMYLGQVVELLPKSKLWSAATHPYSQLLIQSVPHASAQRIRIKDRVLPQGELPSPYDVPSGCRFKGRCPHAQAQCHDTAPTLRVVGEGHWVACHLHPRTAVAAPSIEKEGS